MERDVAFIGFGEAGQAFAALRSAGGKRGYDRKTEVALTRKAKQEDYRRCGVTGEETPHDALADAEIVLSLVTADQALAAARSCAPVIRHRALWLDMNSVAPETKRTAAAVIEDAGGRYVDVAVMSPVERLRLDAPLMVNGPHAECAAQALTACGFGSVRVIDGPVGAASAIKMIRSVMVKGVEALTAECMLAAEAAGVRDEVLTSLDASERGGPWAERADYNLGRMLVHGLRRAAEMQEVVKTLEALGTGSVMSRGTAERQRQLGSLGLAMPAGLGGKLAALTAAKLEKAA